MKPEVIKIIINATALSDEDVSTILEDVAARLRHGDRSFMLHGPGGLVGSCVVEDK